MLGDSNGEEAALGEHGPHLALLFDDALLALALLCGDALLPVVCLAVPQPPTNLKTHRRRKGNDKTQSASENRLLPSNSAAPFSESTKEILLDTSILNTSQPHCSQTSNHAITI